MKARGKIEHISVLVFDRVGCDRINISELYGSDDAAVYNRH